MVTISEEEFGVEKVAPICTFNSLSTKVAIKDIGKVLNARGVYEIPYSLRDQVAKAIPTIKTLNDLGEEEEKETLLKDVLKDNENLSDIYERYPLWFQYVMRLEGSPKSLGRHAAGTIIAPKNLLEYAPLCLDSDGNKMLQIEMHNAMDDLGLIKMDFLGLETLDIVDDCLSIIGKKWSDFNINKLNLDDKKVLKNIYAKGNTIGIFQMESPEAKKMCIEAETDTIEDAIAVNAFNRPGTKNGFPTYCKNKKNPSSVKVLHEDLRKIFNKTHFVLLYQEQSLQMFRHAGFKEDEVDNARRAIGHKEAKTMESLGKDFRIGLEKIGWKNYQIDEMWELMKKQAEYSFNRGHSVAYSLLSYLTAYLKYYYPIEYMTACLNSKMGDTGKTGVLLNECRRLNISVLPPNINKSKELYFPDLKSNSILYGLNPIKGVGKKAAKFLIENQPYKNFNNFLDKVKNSSFIDKTTIEALIKSGAIPCNSKNNMLKIYAESRYKPIEFKEVQTLPVLRELKDKWGINTDCIKDNNERLRLYNIKRREKYNIDEPKRKKKKIDEFLKKTIGDESLYEFEVLSMFLTNNPFNEFDQNLISFSETEEFCDCTIIASIVDIKKKKDKNKNVFCYLDLFTANEGIIEGICWASSYGKYQDMLEKGKHIVILGTKKENKLTVGKIKSLDQWKKDMQFNK